MKTVVGLFDDMAQAKQAALDLEKAGIPHDDISLVANKHVSREHADMRDISDTAKGASIGAALGGTAGLLAGWGLLAILGLGPSLLRAGLPLLLLARLLVLRQVALSVHS